MGMKVEDLLEDHEKHGPRMLKQNMAELEIDIEDIHDRKQCYEEKDWKRPLNECWYIFMV